MLVYYTRLRYTSKKWTDLLFAICEENNIYIQKKRKTTSTANNKAVLKNSHTKSLPCTKNNTHRKLFRIYIFLAYSLVSPEIYVYRLFILFQFRAHSQYEKRNVKCRFSYTCCWLRVWVLRLLFVKCVFFSFFFRHWRKFFGWFIWIRFVYDFKPIFHSFSFYVEDVYGSKRIKYFECVLTESSTIHSIFK